MHALQADCSTREFHRLSYRGFQYHMPRNDIFYRDQPLYIISHNDLRRNIRPQKGYFFNSIGAPQQ
jgi:hypothetical protein